MIEKQAISTTFNIKDGFKNLIYKQRFAIEHPYYFRPSGFVLFCGSQGKGKTLSAVRYINRLCKIYPRAIVVSNIALNLPNCDNVLPYEGIEQIQTMDNGEYGIILFLDEIQIDFASMESKNIPASTLTVISQQRKRRLQVVGTTQCFHRVAKPWREQCSCVIDCKTFLFDFWQRNLGVDFDSIAEDANGSVQTYGYSWATGFFRSPKHYDMYDTFEKVSRTKKKAGNRYGNN